MAVDHALVRELQEQVGARLSVETRRLREQGHVRLSREDERELASELIVQVIVEHRRTLLESGKIPLEPQQEDETVPTPTDQSETSGEQGNDTSEDTARRRASLNKEIRAGWRRALGH